MTQPAFGINFHLLSDTAYPPTFGDFSVLGIVLPSDDANATVFPLNTPVDTNTGDAATLAALGTGPLYQTILRVNSQLADLQQSARAVIVRVATGANDYETMVNIIGNADAGTGIYALLKAPQMIGVTPRLLGMPGFTGTFETVAGNTPPTVTKAAKAGGNTGTGPMTLASPAALTLAQAGIYAVRCIGGATTATSAHKVGGNTGTGNLGTLTSDSNAAVGVWTVVCQHAATGGGSFVVYNPAGGVDGIAVVGTAYNSAAGPNFTISAATNNFIVGDEFDITVTASVPSNGGVFSVKDPNGVLVANATVGSAFATQIGFTIADGTPDFSVGDGFDLTVAITAGQALANPLCAALPAICEALMACAVVGGPGTGKTAAILWETSLNSKRLIPVDNWEIIQDGDTTAYIDGAAAVLGVGVRVDFQHNGYPFWSFANQPVQGLLGLKNVYNFSLVDGATDSQELLTDCVGVTVRGDHSDVSLTDAGWQLICYSTASTDPTWTLLNKVRGRDFIHLALLKSIRNRLGNENVTLHSVQSVLNDMTAVAAQLQAVNCLIGWVVAFNSVDNTALGLRAGKFTVTFLGEQPAPILVVTINSGTDLPALTAELAALNTQISSISG
jgi:hypothetical protein